MKNLDVQKIYEWPFVAQLLVIFLLTFMVVYLGYFFDIMSLKDSIKAAQQQENDLKQQFKVTLDQQLTTTGRTTLQPKFIDLLNNWESRLISKKDLPILLDEILKKGKDAQLKFNSFDPGTEIKQGDYVVIPVKIVMKGTYDQIATFISQVANMSKLVSIGNFSISKEEEAEASANPEPLNSEMILLSDLTLNIYSK